MLGRDNSLFDQINSFFSLRGKGPLPLGTILKMAFPLSGNKVEKAYEFTDVTDATQRWPLSTSTHNIKMV